MHRYYKYIIFVLAGLWAQDRDFTAAWEQYNQVEYELNQLNDNIELFNSQQKVIQAEIDNLMSSRNWYNGWYNELLIAGKSRTLADMSDSLQAFSAQLEQVSARRDQALIRIREIYSKIVSSGDLSDQEKERAINLGSQILARRPDDIELPDYEKFLAVDFESNQIRQLVLTDLAVVVRAKLTLVDSLLGERRKEIELLNRLNEFHDDLSLLQESERDLGSPDQTNRSFVSQSTAGGLDNGAEDGSFTDDPSSKEQTELSDVGQSGRDLLAGVTISGSELPETQELSGDVANLITKKNQYQNLLDKIASSLSQEN